MCRTLWAPSLAIVRLQWPAVLEEVDERSVFQTEDNTQRAVVYVARACRLACAIGHGRRARHPDAGSHATLRSRAHQ